MKEKDRMVWVDLATSGEDPETDTIERMHVIVTDKDLEIVAQSPPTEVGDGTERAAIALISAHVGKGAGLLAGNRVRDVRRFLADQMPDLSAYLHYRTIDVSTIRELVRRWYPDAYEARPRPSEASGITGAIEELRYYRTQVFRQEELEEAGVPETAQKTPLTTGTSTSVD